MSGEVAGSAVAFLKNIPDREVEGTLEWREEVKVSGDSETS